MTHPTGQHPQDRRPPRAPRPQAARRGGGVPDGLLVGALAVAVSVTVLVWSATGIAGWLRHGEWPENVSLMRTAGALRSFLTAPSDVTGAWPDTDPDALPGAALLWMVFVAQLTVLFSTFLWTAIRIGRWRARRAARAAAVPVVHERDEPSHSRPHEDHAPHRHGDFEDTDHRDYSDTANRDTAYRDTAYRDSADFTHEKYQDAGGGIADEAGYPDVPRPEAPRSASAAPPTDPVTAVLKAPGGIVVPDPDGTLHRKTARQRGRTGPVHVYDPGHTADDVPVRLRWAPHRGCEDLSTARWRAIAFLSPVRPAEPVFQLDADTAETLLRCYLHAAALSSQPFHHIQRWAQGRNGGEAAKVLRTHPRAAPGSSMELESALTSHPGRRDAALALIQKALSGLDRLHIRQSCAPGRVDALAMDNIAGEDGTLYIIGDDDTTAPFRAALLDAVTPALTQIPPPAGDRPSPPRR
ncbi:type VI secretion protein [Streptomyces sp. YIM 98790]|uniref:type VI secretion protein n=1 Tax=Streptomyces sp. YIM 98790 TaxID=2689077 RepID=UPI00140895F6|nr:type VI secretion protein [Streptomyces sp. YIM 98790]